MLKTLRNNTNLMACMTEFKKADRNLIGAEIANALKNVDLEMPIQKGKFYINKTTKERSLKKFKNAKNREIVYLKDADLRRYLSKIGQVLEKYFLIKRHQHGFNYLKDTSTFVQDYLLETVDEIELKPIPHALMEMDLHNAFEQISAEWVLTFFKYGCNLSWKKAYFLTECSTHKGHLYQGCPFSPALFNAYTLGLIRDINRIPGTSALSYADDILIVNKNYKLATWKWIRFIDKIFKQYNLVLNEKKSRLLSGTDKIQYLGMWYRYPYSEWRELPDGKLIPRVRHQSKYIRRYKHVSKMYWKYQYIPKRRPGQTWTNGQEFVKGILAGLKGWIYNMDNLIDLSLLENSYIPTEHRV